MSGFSIFTISQSFLKLMSIELMMPSSHLNICHFILLLLSIFFSIRVFSNELTLCIRQSKYWSFSNSPFNEYSRLIFFRIDCFDLLAVQQTSRVFSATQIERINSSTRRHFYGPTVTSVHDYQKTTALSLWTSVSKMLSLFFICCLDLSYLILQGANVF